MLATPEQTLAEFGAQFWRPRARPDPVIWCPANLTIDERGGESHYRGPFSLDIAPDLPEILRAMCAYGEFSDTETTVIVGPTQSLKTTLLIGAAGYTIHHRPGDITWVMDSINNCRDFSKKRWQSTAAASPIFRDISLDENDAITNLVCNYRTGTLRFAGSNSPGKVASFPAATVVGDEVDKYPGRVRNEAGTLELVIERMSGAYSFRSWLASTPTVAFGKIWQEAHKGDCRKFFVPCPHCSAWWNWQFRQLRWDENAKNADGKWDMLRVERTAHYQCPICENEIHEQHRRDMMFAGQWRATELQPTDPRRRSYFRNCFHVLHPNRSFARIAQKHLDAGRDPSSRQNFTNSWLAEVSKEDSLTIASTDVQARAEAYLSEPPPDRPDQPLVLPSGVLVLTAGVDVQESPPRLEAEIVGHGEGEESWGIEYRVFHGDPERPEVWADLDRWLLRRWLHPGRFVLAPAAVCIDSGHLADTVYRFVKPRLGRYVFATKGSSGGYGEPLVSRARKSGVHAVPLFMIGTTTAKETVYTRLQITTPGPGYMHFPKDPKRGYDSAYFRQLTAEECTVVWKAGRKVKKFVNPSGRRNEALDIRCMALAARELRNPDFIALAEQARQIEMELEPGEAAADEQFIAMKKLQADKDHEDRMLQKFGEDLAAQGVAVAEFDPATGKIEKPPTAPAKQLTAAEVQALPANTYKPVDAPAAPAGPPVPSRRKNFATSW
jgi:phage terminase large subunit GpA-like protein